MKKIYLRMIFKYFIKANRRETCRNIGFLNSTRTLQHYEHTKFSILMLSLVYDAVIVARVRTIPRSYRVSTEMAGEVFF